MSILVCGRSLALVGSGEQTFEGVREVEGLVIGTPPRGPRQARRLLDATRVSCRAIGDICSAGRCVSCERFVNFVPSPDRRHVTIRCYWNGDDPVADLMTSISNIVAVPVDAEVGEARLLAAEYERDFLLVVDAGVLVGIARRPEIEWADPRRRVSELTTRKVWTVTPDATLADVARIMSRRDADCALVVDDDKLVGMVTRDDLREVGWTDSPA
jgi:hypothetical protein